MKAVRYRGLALGDERMKPKAAESSAHRVFPLISVTGDNEWG